MWFIMAVLSAFFAGITSILAKCGIKKTDSDVATALRTFVVLLFAWIMVFVVGSISTISAITTKSLLFLILSGMATGGSWICYFKALSIGDVNKVVPIDKSSTILSILFAIILFKETQNLAIKLVGTVVLAAGIYLMVEKKQDYKKENDRKWKFYAVLSALFAALTSILAKIGIDGIESNLGTAIRTGVVFVMAWIIVIAKRKQMQIGWSIQKPYDFHFSVLRTPSVRKYLSSKWIKRDVSKTKIRLDTFPFIHFDDKYFRTEGVFVFLEISTSDYDRTLPTYSKK